MPTEFVPAPVAINAVPEIVSDDPVIQESLELLRRGHEFDQIEAARQIQFAKDDAIARVRAKKAEEMLLARIEEMYAVAYGAVALSGVR